MNKHRKEAWAELYAEGFSRRDCDRILRDATGLQRRSEIQCSIDVGERENARLERKDNLAAKRLADICAKYGATASIQGDPRGWPITITTKDGKEIGVPGIGLPARCFA